MEILNKALTAMAAAVLGWLLVSLPKVTRNVMSWKIMLSSIGVAAVVGFITNSIIANWLPSWPEDVRCSIAAIMGASCDQWILRYNRLVETVADKAEDVILDHMPGHTHDEHEENDGKDHDTPKPQ